MQQTRKLTLTRRVKVRTATETGATYRWEATAAEYMADIAIDVDAILLELATKAVQSKGRKARYMRGRILVAVRPVTRD